jgi:hypothetical protein
MVRHLALPAVAVGLGLLLSTSSPMAYADTIVRCASEGYRYHACRLPDHGFVRLHRQLSSTACAQGRNWDFNAREVWVDDGCAAEFLVEPRHHGSGSDAGKAAAAIAAIAILGAVASQASRKDEPHYSEKYQRGGHSSHVPEWMIGTFRGYNPQHRTDVEMRISEDGRMSALTQGHDLRGYVNDRRLYVGDAIFEIERTGDGFQTVQVGDWGNRVRYVRR